MELLFFLGKTSLLYNISTVLTLKAMMYDFWVAKIDFERNKVSGER